MSYNNTYEKFREYVQDDRMICTESELNEFLMYGLLLDNNGSYITRDNKSLIVDVIKPKILDFDINLSGIINNCCMLSKESNFKRIYCMTERCYNIYKDKGLIINKEGRDYYRYYDKELWLINIIK